MSSSRCGLFALALLLVLALTLASPLNTLANVNSPRPTSENPGRVCVRALKEENLLGEEISPSFRPSVIFFPGLYPLTCLSSD